MSKKLLSRVIVEANIEVDIGNTVVQRVVRATYENKQLFKKRNRKDAFWIALAVEEHGTKKSWIPEQIISCKGKVERKYD